MKKVNLTGVVYTLELAGVLGLLYGTYLTGQMLLGVPSAQWGIIGFGLITTLLRVLAALILSLLWTVPVGVAIGSNVQLTSRLQP